MIEIEVNGDTERRNSCQHAAVISRARDLHPLRSGPKCIELWAIQATAGDFHAHIS